LLPMAVHQSVQNLTDAPPSGASPLPPRIANITHGFFQPEQAVTVPTIKPKLPGSDL
jgi:hypothetical protein